MDRRNFFRTMIGGVAAAAAVRSWPFRVYSFPSEVKIPACMGRPLLASDLSRPELLVKQGGIFWQTVHDGGLGRGSGTAYRRVFPYDDLDKLLREGWHDPRIIEEERCSGVTFSDR